MQKKDLKYGNVAEFRNGEKGILLLENNEKSFFILNGNEDLSTFLRLSSLDDNLKKYPNQWDIMKVYKDYTCGKLLWVRPKEPLLYMDEKEYLKALLKSIDANEVFIMKSRNLCNEDIIKIGINDNYIYLFDTKYMKLKFTGLDYYKQYQLKELCLED